MPEVNLARETLDAAQAFQQLRLRTQWSYRTTLSRLYYAAHHLGRALLRSVGLMPQHWRRNVHERVIDELQNHYVLTGSMTGRTLYALRRLRIYRIQADYNLMIAIQPTQVNAAINLFTAYSNECLDILGVT